MAKTKNPAPGKAQGFGNSVSRKNEYTAASLTNQQNFAAEWLARRARLPLAVASAYCEAHGLGGAQ